ncbi:EamA family transporter [uncultured Alistipes sp.]|nr:EamA family transporter [uncultured Alistipes sp.]
MDNFQGNDIILQAKKTGTIMNTQREGGNFKGIICAIISSGTFGLIPLFSIPLLLSGLSSQTILFWRFVLAALMMGIVALATKRSFRISLHEVWTLLLLAVMYSATALCLLQSYNYIPSGVATTISFLYPLAVAIVMTLFFREKSSVWLFVAILISLAGVALLSWNGEGIAGNRETLVGMGYAGLTVMTYMVYIVGVMKSSVSRLDPMILAFYVLLFSSLFFLLYTTTGNGFQTPSTWNQWQNMLLLALIPTVLSNLTLVLAIQQIGSTMTSILGSMEPLTAVLVGVFRFGESFSLDMAIGLILIISAVMIVILNPGRTKRHTATA